MTALLRQIGLSRIDVKLWRQGGQYVHLLERGNDEQIRCYQCLEEG